MVIQKLSNEFLIEAYLKAIKLKINSDFISLLKEEIKRRRIGNGLVS